MLLQTPLETGPIPPLLPLQALGISWEDRVTNQEVLCCSSMPGVEVLIMKAQLRWTRHVMRMEDSCLPKQIFCSELARSTQRQGGQTKHYKDSLKNSL